MVYQKRRLEDDQFDAILRHHDIIQEGSSAYTQSQNGSAERFGRVIGTMND